MNVSELEQDLACRDSQSDQFRGICAQIEDPAVDSVDALRLVMLFALRYETNRGTKIDELKERLRTYKRLSPRDLLLIDAVLAYGGVASRGGDLFGKNSMLSKLSTTVKVRRLCTAVCRFSLALGCRAGAGGGWYAMSPLSFDASFTRVRC